jgi:hypothetical protein
MALGMVLESVGKTDKAKEVYEDQLEAKYDLNVSGRLVALYLRNSQFEEALKTLEVMSVLDAEDLNTKMKIGLIQMQKKDWIGAQATFASKLVIEDGKAVVTREVDGGLETLSLSLPAIVTTDLRLNEPRYVTLPNIMKAKKKTLDVMTPDALGVDVAPRLKTLKVVEPAKRTAGTMVPDVATLVAKLRNEAKVI